MTWRIYIYILTIFKTSLETDFNHLKESTSRNIQNIQTLLNLQQTYSSSLCLHINNIYSKLSELQKQIQHHRMYMNQGDMIQIEAPEIDLDIDGDRQLSTIKKPDEASIPGTLPTIPEVIEPEDEVDLPLAQIQHNQLVKKLIGLMLSPCKFQESLHRQLSQKNKVTIDVKPSTTLKILKSPN